MKREEAIELLEDLDGAIEDNQGRDYDEAFRMAIEALSTEIVSFEDAMQIRNTILVKEYLRGRRDAEAEVVQGEWIKTVDGNGWNEWGVLTCPLCGASIEDKYYHSWKYNFCPNCGARMKGGEDE